ncbi:hypothetical protein EDB19DRAFT_302827 [Suillus lakei]|nr:hypothetical protein EDB19DRAFT_302827 [Suillus lakei]
MTLLISVLKIIVLLSSFTPHVFVIMTHGHGCQSVLVTRKSRVTACQRAENEPVTCSMRALRGSTYLVRKVRNEHQCQIYPRYICNASSLTQIQLKLMPCLGGALN